MLLDIRASQAVAQAKLFEMAVNSGGPWEIRIGDQTEYAVKIRTDLGVIFVAHFDDGAYGDVAWLLHQGTEVSSRPVDPPPGPFTMEWRLGMGSTQTDSVGV